MKKSNPRRIHVNCSPTLSMSPAVQFDSCRLNTGTTAHRSTCTRHGTEDGTAVQFNTVDLKFAGVNLYFNVLQSCKVLCNVHCSRYLLRNAVQQSELQFALCKQYYKELQCNTRELQLSLSQCCSETFVTCNLLCYLHYTVLR